MVGVSWWWFGVDWVVLIFLMRMHWGGYSLVYNLFAELTRAEHTNLIAGPSEGRAICALAEGPQKCGPPKLNYVLTISANRLIAAVYNIFLSKFSLELLGKRHESTNNFPSSL